MARTKLINDYRPLTPANMEKVDDIDPASLEIFTHVFESPSGREYFRRYIMKVLSEMHCSIHADDHGLHIRLFLGPEYITSLHEIPLNQQIKKDSWLKKWIKRQLT